MKKVLLTVLATIIFSACSAEVVPTVTPEPVVEVAFDQVIDNGKIYTSKDFFDAGFKEYKEYNVSKLTGATEAWYGYWGPDEDSVKYYELRFYPDYSTAVSEGTAFAEDATGEDAVLGRKDTMWRVGLPDRKLTLTKTLYGGERPSTQGGLNPKYHDYVVYNNVIMLCEGVDSEKSIKACWELIDLVSK